MALVFVTKNAVIFSGFKSGACYFFGWMENILNWASLSKFMQSAPPPGRKGSSQITDLYLPGVLHLIAITWCGLILFSFDLFKGAFSENKTKCRIVKNDVSFKITIFLQRHWKSKSVKFEITTLHEVP